MFDIEDEADTSDLDLESRNPELFGSFSGGEPDGNGNGECGDQPGNVQELLRTIQLLKVSL